MEAKQCTKCGEVRSLSEFCKRKDSKDGYYGTCKVCKREYNKGNYVPKRGRPEGYHLQHRSGIWAMWTGGELQRLNEVLEGRV